jgi:2-C-methyl-D-erythritol 4-phosphate cytidylyltransferase
VDASDDCLLVEWLGLPVAVVPGEVGNRKITHPEDLEWLRGQLP